ncbi:MAG: hypothetical protein ISR69_13855 [Gammaproteobacteria bacterium]|nr:hypothetical protein [Gammaproteobacteria bacterium]
MKIKIYSIVLLFILFGCIGCKGNENNQSLADSTSECDFSPSPYIFNFPSHFPEYNIPRSNATTFEGIALGRRLYYDKLISKGGPMAGNACASCHVQTTSFSKVTTSGTSVLPHINLGYASFFLWDGKISGSLEDIMYFEVADFFQADLLLINANDNYRKMNCEAFGTFEVTYQSMANSLAQWLRRLNSHKSKYDMYLEGLVELTSDELSGKILFEGAADCHICHPLPLTTDFIFHNNGLNEFSAPGDAGLNEIDQGRYKITHLESDLGLFKTPTLRNIVLTSPYMHDGRFKTLEEVVQHYNRNLKYSWTLDFFLGQVKKDINNESGLYILDMSEGDVNSIVAFLKTLTDQSFIVDPDLSSPFVD